MQFILYELYLKDKLFKESGGEVSLELSKDSKAGGQRFKEMKGKCVGLEDSPPDQGVGGYKDSKLEKRRGH